MSDAVRMLPRIELVRATREQQPIVANLMELYVHDFSEFYPIEPGPDGRFGYKDLALYWSEQNRQAFLVRVNDRWAGFVLIRQERDVKGSGQVWDVAEFFVVRAWRRHSVGTVVAHELWRRLPGRWQVRVMQANAAGGRFWEKAVLAFAGDDVRVAHFDRDGLSWRLFSFEAKRGVGDSPGSGSS
jgi:predicted acetyltransferase